MLPRTSPWPLGGPLGGCVSGPPAQAAYSSSSGSLITAGSSCWSSSSSSSSSSSIIVVGVSRRHLVTHDGDEAPVDQPPVLGKALGHVGLLLDVATFAGGFERWRTSISPLSIALIGRGSPAFSSPLLLTFLFSTRDLFITPPGNLHCWSSVLLFSPGEHTSAKSARTGVPNRRNRG